MTREAQSLILPQVRRVVSGDVLASVRRYLGYRFPGMKDAPLLETRVCQYENTSDKQFHCRPVTRQCKRMDCRRRLRPWIQNTGPALGEMAAKLVLKNEAADLSPLPARTASIHPTRKHKKRLEAEKDRREQTKYVRHNVCHVLSRLKIILSDLSIMDCSVRLT